MGVAGLTMIAAPMACLDLACQILMVGDTYSRSELIKMSGTAEKDYMQAFTAVRNLLNIKIPVSVSQLAIGIGCARIQNTATQNLNQFMAKFRSQLSSSRQEHLSFQNNTAFAAAAVYLSALQAKLKVDKPKLMNLVNCTDTSFDSACAQFIEFMPNLKPPEVVKKEVKEREKPSPPKITPFNPFEFSERDLLSDKNAPNSNVLKSKESKQSGGSAASNDLNSSLGAATSSRCVNISSSSVLPVEDHHLLLRSPTPTDDLLTDNDDPLEEGKETLLGRKRKVEECTDDGVDGHSHRNGGQKVDLPTAEMPVPVHFPNPSTLKQATLSAFFSKKR